jgi:ABC-type Fe3+ transport system permease subunit
VQAGSLQAYSRALHAVSYSLLRSVFLAAAGATALTVLGFFVGYLIHTRALPIWRAVDAGTVVLFALPSTVIGWAWWHSGTSQQRISFTERR